MTKDKEKKLLNLLSYKPLSPGMILNHIPTSKTDTLLKTFCKLRRQGKIEMIGLYPCRSIKGRKAPYYLSYSLKPSNLKESIND